MLLIQAGGRLDVITAQSLASKPIHQRGLYELERNFVLLTAKGGRFARM